MMWFWTFSKSFVHLKWKSMRKKQEDWTIEDEFQNTDVEDEETLLYLLAQYEIYGYLKKMYKSCQKTH